MNRLAAPTHLPPRPIERAFSASGGSPELKAPTRTESGARDTPQQRKPRVLVVDDCPDTAESFGFLLRGWEYSARVAYDGPTALAIADEFLPNVVLLDIGLPAMSGYEVAEEIRRRPELKGVVLVAQTGFGRQKDRDVAELAGFDHYFLKPVDPEVLKGFLDSL